MICRLSTKITDKLLTRNVIDVSEYDLYLYGLFVVLSNLFLVSFCLLFGVLFNMIIPSTVFFVTFLLFHKFAGGFHATTENHCQIITLSSSLCCLIGIKLAIIHCSMNISTFILMFCVLLVLILFSPADTPQKPLAKDEKKRFKNKVIALAITTFILLLILFFFFDSITFIFFPILFGVLLETVSVIAGKMLNGKEVF